MAVCANCGAENPADKRFCGDCGSPLARVCSACGAENPPEKKFCGDCGASLAEHATAAQTVTAGPVAERRLVSVLFADLVGFTPLSESRDPEEVRDLLTRYFDSCRRLIERYGGVVEKFIGDAVMAVWGTPTAQEDDAERAVRAALELVAAVAALGEELGVPELQARAGVQTGEAAVTLAAAGEGMVAGDLVNTAARIQAAAQPGSALVGEATRRAAELAIAFEQAGEHVLKGKAEPARLWRAVRVTAARGGALRSEGLEAPFVGREREMRLIKELFHAAAEQSRAQLVQITGVGGIGKSRLAWEFFKYIDGLAEQVWWHSGRCLTYGEGVAYSALAEMVRTRARIVEGDEQAIAREKLAACLAEHLPADEEERAWVRPRLANLLGLEERADTDRQDLFAAWRLFFERLADQRPLVMVFEDLQWADQALLDFIEYLLEWSSSQRLYVLALSRPELAEQRPEFARHVRNSTSLALEPLSDAEMAALLDGYVPGLPATLKDQVLARAQGVPLYAVETVRMLLDRGLLANDGTVYRPTEEIASLEIPETLHALAASRLDGLPLQERSLVQVACVLGKSFTKQALAAVTALGEQELEPMLARLVRNEVLFFHTDPRQPEHGQYGFLQELLRQVSYDTLSRRDRKARHLAVAAALEQSVPDGDRDLPELIAAHLLAAADALPGDEDADQIRVRAREALVQAGHRAAALAAPDQAQRYLDQAAALAADEPSLQAQLLMQAGTFAFEAGRSAEARQRLERTIQQFQRENEPVAAARAGTALGDVDFAEGALNEAIRRFEGAVPALENAGATAELVATLAQLGRMQSVRGDLAVAAETLERALGLAEQNAQAEPLLHALTSKGTVLTRLGRWTEARMLLEGVLAQARSGEFHSFLAVRTVNNLGVLFEFTEDYANIVSLLDDVEARARQRGDREQLAIARLSAIPSLVELGRWQETLERTAERDQLQASPFARLGTIYAVPVLCERGDLDTAEALLREHEWQRDAEQRDVLATRLGVEARMLRARNRPAEALSTAGRGLALRRELSMADRTIRLCLVEALEAALELDDLGKADELLGLVEALRPGELTPTLAAQHARFRARLAARRGEHGNVEHDYRTAQTIFAERGLIFHRAVAALEYGEWLINDNREQEAVPLLADARQSFAALEARPWLERLDAAAPARETEIAV